MVLVFLFLTNRKFSVQHIFFISSSLLGFGDFLLKCMLIKVERMKKIELYNSLSQVQLFFSVQLKPGGHSLSIRGYSARRGFLRLKVMYQRVGNSGVEVFFVCSHVTRRSCWRSIQCNFFLKNLHENRVQFPEKRNALVISHQVAAVTSSANQQYEREGKYFLQVFEVARYLPIPPKFGLWTEGLWMTFRFSFLSFSRPLFSKVV